MKRTLLPLLLILILFVFDPLTAQSGPIPYNILPGDPVPAQSTSGPLPPVGVSAPAFAPSATQAAVLITGVPAYYWRHGCGPTAAGMLIGYYDTHSYPWLIPGDSSTQTYAVDEAIASQNTPTSISNHYEDYSKPLDDYPVLYLDRSGAPVGDEHISNSIADFMFTSFSSQNNRYGWSWSNHVGPALVNYVHLKQPTAAVNYSNYGWGGSLWSQYQTEINANRPVVFLVDSSGDGGTDHFITGIGYEEVGGVKTYATWDTWYDTVRWQEFVQMQNGKAWGIYQMTTLLLTYTNPPPTITQITPIRVPSGHGLISLQVNGTGFIETSVVRWNGADRQTTYLSPTRLTAVITIEDLANPTTANITVFTPAPGGGTTNTATFVVLDGSTFTNKVMLPALMR